MPNLLQVKSIRSRLIYSKYIYDSVVGVNKASGNLALKNLVSDKITINLILCSSRNRFEAH